MYSKNGTDASLPRFSTARDVAELYESSHGNFHSSLVFQNPESQCVHFLEDWKNVKNTAQYYYVHFAVDIKKKSIKWLDGVKNTQVKQEQD